MTTVRWSPNLSVGSDAIDAEHMLMIDLLNSLIADIEAKRDGDKLTESLDALMDCTSEHFHHEEQIMENAEYPDLERHRRLHEALKSEIQEFRRELEAGMDIGPETTDFLRTWLISHIMESDKQLGGFLQGRAAAQSSD